LQILQQRKEANEDQRVKVPFQNEDMEEEKLKRMMRSIVWKTKAVPPF